MATCLLPKSVFPGLLDSSEGMGASPERIAGRRRACLPCLAQRLGSSRTVLHLQRLEVMVCFAKLRREKGRGRTATF